MTVEASPTIAREYRARTHIVIYKQARLPDDAANKQAAGLPGRFSEYSRFWGPSVVCSGANGQSAQ